MEKYLIKNTLIYRVASVDDALKLRSELQQLNCGELTSFSYNTKYIKSKGEVIDEYQLVKAQIDFNEEKNPENSLISIEYND